MKNILFNWRATDAGQEPLLDAVTTKVMWASATGALRDTSIGYRHHPIMQDCGCGACFCVERSYIICGKSGTTYAVGEQAMHLVACHRNKLDQSERDFIDDIEEIPSNIFTDRDALRKVAQAGSLNEAHELFGFLPVGLRRSGWIKKGEMVVGYLHGDNGFLKTGFVILVAESVWWNARNDDVTWFCAEKIYEPKSENRDGYRLTGSHWDCDVLRLEDARFFLKHPDALRLWRGERFFEEAGNNEDVLSQLEEVLKNT